MDREGVKKVPGLRARVEELLAEFKRHEKQRPPA